jgi:hypothetical protein
MGAVVPKKERNYDRHKPDSYIYPHLLQIWGARGGAVG